MKGISPELSTSALSALRSQLRGATIVPGEEGYEAGRRVWNAAIDRAPSAIIRCADAEDVSFAVRIAADHGLPLTIRGGGHNVAGRSIGNGRLLLDLSLLRNVAVNRDMMIATVQGGALWGDVDAATAVEGLATTGGLVSSTGVGGFTLGGGAGWLMRKHGLACDNLRSAGIVLPDGRFVRASANEHEDLFWGLRGGAGGFGVVTSFEYHLHPMQEVLAGLIVHPAERALDALRAFRDFASGAADEFCGLAAIVHAPPLPFLDAAWHGKPVVLLALCWCGDVNLGGPQLAALRAHGRPIADHLGPMPYVQWQKMQDAGAPPGRHHYWKTRNFESLSEATLEALAAAARQLPTRYSEIHVQHMGGAVARIRTDESAFGHRSAQFFVNFLGVSESPQQIGMLRDRIRSLHERTSGGALPGTLPNFGDQDDSDEALRFGREHAIRIAALRRRYDPAGMMAAS